MTRSRQALGAQGEEIAARYLEAQGLRVQERNVRFKSGEIDIVAWEDSVLVFVEVRARRSVAHGSALESVDARKVRRLANLARTYVHSRRMTGVNCRFDVVGVTWTPGRKAPLIQHVRDAFSV